MDATLTFTIAGPPVPQPRPRVSTWGGLGRAYTPKSHPITAYRQSIAIRAAMAAKAARWQAVAGPVELEVACTFQRPPSHLKASGGLTKAAPAWPPRCDVDNLAKGVQDAVTDSGAVWLDDDQVVRLVVSKAYGPVARTEITIRTVTT